MKNKNCKSYYSYFPSILPLANIKVIFLPFTVYGNNLKKMSIKGYD